MKTTSSTRAAGARPYCRTALLCLGFLTAVLGAYIAGVNSNDTRTPAALDPLCRAADEIASSLAGPADAALGSFCDRGGAGGNGGADGGADTLPRGAVNGPVNAAPDLMNHTSTLIKETSPLLPDVVGALIPPPPLPAPGGLVGEGGGHDIPSELATTLHAALVALCRSGNGNGGGSTVRPHTPPQVTVSFPPSSSHT